DELLLGGSDARHRPGRGIGHAARVVGGPGCILEPGPDPRELGLLVAFQAYGVEGRLWDLRSILIHGLLRGCNGLSKLVERGIAENGGKLRLVGKVLLLLGDTS